MAELRALCSGCRQTLSGPLVANTCNHVFHRDCLHAASTCRQCSKKICHEKALSLYNLSFADGDGDARVMTAVAELKRKRESREDVVASEDELEDEDLETEALALQDAGSSQCGTPTTEDNAVKEAAELVLLRQKLSELRDRVQTAKSSREKAVEYREQQQSRFRTVQHAVEKQEADVAKIKAGVKNAYQERDKISEQLQKVSLRDAVVEYWQVLRESPAKALETLTTYVSLVPDPARVMTEVARLRDNQRKLADQDLAEASRADQRYKKARREIEELEKTAKALREELDAAG
mmetsp:Transcript_42643/g.99387  ORF Transcript_42643/g.99387 Transcript_42643/m.99387 type:complete len:293 (+) Transcript_42643:14-892(+)